MDKKVPEIRFKEFDGEWTTHQLNYYLVTSTEKNQSEEYDKYDIYSVSREYGVINQIAYQGKSFAGVSLENYRVIMPDDVVYTKSPLKLQPYGIIKTNEGQSGIVSALYGVFHPTDKVCSTFVQTYFELDSRLNDYLRPLVNKGAKNTLLISDADSLNGDVAFPQKEEQEKLVAMFTTIDKLIRKLEQKLEKLRNIKQALLNQMFINFNRGGYEAPLLRFKNHNEEWQMIPLANISTKVLEKNLSKEFSQVFTNSAEFGIINQQDYFDRNIANESNIQGYYVVRPNDYAYNPRISTSAPVGPVNRNKLNYSGVMSPLYFIFRVDGNKVNLEYLDFFFKGKSWHSFMYANGNSGARSDRFSINDETFIKLPIFAPKDICEQEEVGKYFSSLDLLIKESGNKLNKVRTIKQSLLQKMFA